MKRLFRKDNRIARLIAMWLVFIMALTPLYQHSGLKNPTKAAAGTAEFTLDIDVTKFITVDSNNNTVAKIENGATVSYSVTGDSAIHKMYYWDNGYETVNIIGNVTGSLTYGNNTNVGYDVGVKVYASGNPDSTISGSESLASSVDATTVADDSIYAVYVKVQSFTYNDGTTDVNADATNNSWHLVAAYSLNQHLIGNVNWLVNDGAYPAGGVANTAYLPCVNKTDNNNQEIAFPDVYLGTFEYSYAKKLSTDGLNIENYKEANAPTIITPGAPVSIIEGKGDGDYVGFIKYSDNTNNWDYRTATIEFDTKGPELRDGWPIKIAQMYGKYEEVKAEADGINYLDISNNKQYSLTFYTEEQNAIKPIRVNFYKQGSDVSSAYVDVDWQSNVPGQGTYYQTYYTTAMLPVGLEEGAVYDVKAALTDVPGNSDEVPLATICPIDKSFKITSYKVNGTDDGALTSPSKDKQTLEVSVSSGEKLGSITVYTDENDDDVYTADSDTLVESYTFTESEASNKTTGLYKNSHTFEIPSTEGVYDNLKIYATDRISGSDTVVVSDSSFTYDVTAPQVSLVGDTGVYKKNDETGKYESISTDEIVDGQYSIDTGLTENFRIYVKVEENLDEAPEVKAYYYATGNVKKPVKTDGIMTPEDSNNKANGNYYMDLSTSELATMLADTDKNILNIEVSAKDDVNLEGIVTITPTIIIPDKTLRIDNAYLSVGGTGKAVDISTGTGNYTNNELFELTITASSGYPITMIEAVKDVSAENPDGTAFDPVVQMTFTEEQNKQNQDAATKRYIITTTIKIPSSIAEDVVNLLLEEVYVKATDNHTPVDATVDPNVVSKRLGTLLYDATKPVMTDVYTGKAFVADDGKWYKALAGENYIEIDAKFTTGPQNVDESTFEDGNITYIVENTAANDILTPSSKGVIINNSDYLSATANVMVPESKNAYGTTVTFNAFDKAGNTLDTNNVVTRKVDAHNPRVTLVTVNGNENNDTPVGKSVKIDATIWDNLAIDKVVVEVQQIDGEEHHTKTFDDDLINYNSNEVTKNVVYELTLPDGNYKATIVATDKAGWESTTGEATFTVDGTAPVVDAKISSGTAGKTNYYYKSNVGVALTCTEKNSANITVTDNGSVVSVDWKTNQETGIQEATYTATTDGLHTIKIEATDGTGNPATAKSVSFIKDTKAPIISAMLNGAINYNESDGVRVFTANTTLNFSEEDANKDTERFYYQMTKKVPDENPVVGKSAPTAYRNFTYTEEAEYTVKVYSIDMANNTSATRTVQFRLDKTAPSISIGGIASGGTSSNPVTVSLNMQELYWQDATGTVEIYMKSGEGFGEELVEEITYTPTGRSSAISRSFAESGIYRIEFNAQDSAGHTATASSTFTIDTEAPVVTLEGVSNYDVTDQDVTVSSTITDKFYASKQITISGTVTDETGKVTPLTIDDYSATANPTTINETFSADGIYDLTITCVDIAGNSDSQTVHFTIDKTAPVIGDLSDYEDKILTSFDWDIDLDELVSDLTVCDVHMYLNGQEYNGEDAVEDGSYVLLITAEDELGHTVEKSVEFVLDTKAPVFIVTGVEDKESRIEPYNITVTLQLEEDTLTSVTLNGEVKTITGNSVTFDVTEIGEYKLHMEATDEAGNVSSAEYEFELEEENEFNIWILIGILALLIIIIIIIILLKRRKNDN